MGRMRNAGRVVGTAGLENLGVFKNFRLINIYYNTDYSRFVCVFI